MSMITLTIKSIWNRRVTVSLTLLTITLSVTLLLGVERIRHGARSSFANTITGTDLIVGARSGPVQLLLYSVFRIGNATNNISWKSYQEFASHPAVKWTIPISLGDSHRGYRVMGTNTDYFQFYRYGQYRALEFAQGQEFKDIYDVVLGADVAEKLDYHLGQRIVVSHGLGKVSFQQHDDKPFQIVGILKKTGTTVDRTLHVSLEGIEAIHIDWKEGAPPMVGDEISAENTRRMKLQPHLITAFMVGLKSKISTFHLQRDINDYSREPLLAILPGVALHDLWRLIGVAEIALLVISGFVVLTGLMGMLTSILTSLNERRREMAILRSVGAHPSTIFRLFVSEAGILSLVGSLGGLIFLYLSLAVAQPWIENKFGLFIPLSAPGVYDFIILGVIFVAGLLMGCLPAWVAYRKSLADGLTMHL